MRETAKKDKVKQDMNEIETINIELEHKHCDSLIAQLNSKSMENANLKGQIQEKIFVNTSLKNDLRKLKGKEIVENAEQIPNATTIVPGMFKLDLDPLAPRIQELLVYVRDTCPTANKPSEKLVVVTPMNKVKKVRWKPTGRTFTLVGNPCPLTRITSTKVVPIKETTSHSVETQKPKIKVYSRRAKQIKSIGSSKNAKIVESKVANKSEPNHSWGSNATDVPSSSSLVNDRFSILFFVCALGKSNKSSHQPKAEDTNQEKLYLLHMDLCGPMRVESINGKKYILVIVDDYSRFTWVNFLRSKDEALDTIIICIKNIQARLNATVRNVRTNNETEFINQTLRDVYDNVGISHQTYIARTP
ncbi:retrovirus-related pol polyprotein from transposon TNT 1-94 [Tanacetum coccineum]